MGDKTSIAWADHTWNPWMGCTRVSPGCANCYAERLTQRMGLRVWGPGADRVRTGAGVWSNPRRWNAQALRDGRRHRVFCGSLMDFFDEHPSVAGWREEALDVIRSTPYLDWLLLTKRVELVPGVLGVSGPSEVRLPENVWLGVSVESADYAWRIDMLRGVEAAVRFVSYEPALGPLGPVDLSGIDWLIYGGESGPGFRPDKVEWAREARALCLASGVAFFHKQRSGYRSGLGEELDGELVQEYPAGRRIRDVRMLCNLFGDEREGGDG